MKNAKFSDAQVRVIPRQAENLVSVSELCCEHGMSSARKGTGGCAFQLDERLICLTRQKS